MAKINFGGTEEEVVTREEFSLEKAREVLKNEVVAVLGYGVQGPAQAMNMRDNGINVMSVSAKGRRIGTRLSQTAGFLARLSSVWKKRRKKVRSFSTYCPMQVNARNGPRSWKH
jgi:glutamate dehydrogenase/leucine dehydrogenase